MRIITKRDRIKRVPERWKAQYCTSSGYHAMPRWGGFGDRSPECVYNQLCALNLDTCTEDDIAAIIGSNGWAKQACSVCQRADPGDILLFSDRLGAFSVTLCEGCAEEIGMMAERMGPD